MTQGIGKKTELLVAEITPTWDQAYEPPEFFGNVISYRSATPSEVLSAALTLEGAYVMNAPEGVHLDFVDDVGQMSPGRYAIIPITDPSTEEE